MVGGVPLLLKKRGIDWEAAVNALAPTAWWRLGESSGADALDEGGTYGGTYINSPLLNQSSLILGDSNPAIRLNGTSQLVSFGNVLNPGTSDFSVICWYNADLWPTSSARVIQKRGTGASGTVSGWQVGTFASSTDLNWGNVVIDAGDGTYTNIPASVDAGLDTDTHMLGLTYDNSAAELLLYIDGVLVGTGSVTGALAGKSISNARTLTMGCADNGDGVRSQFYDGFLDEGLFFLGTKLTPTNISDLYTAGS